jgi:tetratricopeptide (TPR) repeat protein
MALKDTPEKIHSSDHEETTRSQQEESHDTPHGSTGTDDDELDFVITEAHSQDPEMVGGFKSTDSENLGIETPADLMQAEAGTPKEESAARTDLRQFFGGSEPEASSTPAPSSDKPAQTETKSKETPPGPTRDKIERLSDEQLQEISRRMRAESKQSDYLSDEEKQQLISAIGHEPANDMEYSGESSIRSRGTGFATEPIVPPKKTRETRPTPSDVELTGDSPRMSKRSRGVAYFAKGYIRVAGHQELHEGDEMSIAGREYLLRQKRFSSKTIAIAIAAVASIVVLTLGTIFSSSSDIGDGRVIGVVLGIDNAPILTGGEVRFPELGRSFEVNGQGFFKTDQLNAGSYKLEYVNNEIVQATDYATVADNNITTLTLRPAEVQASVPDIQSSTPVTPSPVVASEPVIPLNAQVDRPPSKPEAGGSSPSKPAPGSTTAKLTLVANVDNARLALDGSVIGAGNLTYTKLKPGMHSYTVSKEGYQTVSGTVELKADKTAAVNVTLSPNIAEEKTQPRAELQYYQSATSAMERKDYQSALNDLAKAVEANPSYAEAYTKRAEAYRALNNPFSAHDDYVKAAEVFQSRNDYGQALSAYESAIKANPKSTTALLGRGSLYLARNEAIAAIADFDMVTRLDKRNLDAYIGLGRARYNQGSFDKATKHFKDARSLDANNPVIYQYLMLSQFGQGEFKEVQKDYDKFVKVATPAQVEQIQADRQFESVLRVIEH